MARTVPRMRFSVLDSWRGLCALWVVLYHFRVLSHINDAWITRHGFIAVDFFFALSGFVIAHAYGDKLTGGAQRLRFFLRRFGRLYPLHLVTLAAVVAMETARWAAGRHLGHDIGRPTFAGETSFPALAANLALVQGLGFFQKFSWNIPSWSISVELAVCVIFAVTSILRRPLATALVLAGGASLLLYWLAHNDPWEGHTALTRGVCGFVMGVLAQRLHGLFREKGWTVPGWIEFAAPGLAFAAMWFWDQTIWPASALMFAGIVFIFAFEAGPLSRLMKIPALMAWGEASYSIYLIHYPLVLGVFGAAAVWGAVTGTDLLVQGRTLDLDLGSPWLGDLATLGFLAAVVSLATLTYRWIESPGRRWFNGLSDGIGASRGGA